MAYFIRIDICRSKGLTFIILLLVFFALSPPGLALDPHKKITQYIHDTWRIEQGLPQNTINAVVQTPDGYLWLGTEEGLVRFDGVHFQVYDKNKIEQIANNNVLVYYQDRQGLSGNYITTIYEDREGNLWIGTYGGGLNHFKNGTFTSYTTENGLSNNNVRTIYEDRQGDLWIGTYGGLNLMRNGKFTRYTTREGL